MGKGCFIVIHVLQLRIICSAIICRNFDIYKLIPCRCSWQCVCVCILPPWFRYITYFQRILRCTRIRCVENCIRLLVLNGSHGLKEKKQLSSFDFPELRSWRVFLCRGKWCASFEEIREKSVCLKKTGGKLNNTFCNDWPFKVCITSWVPRTVVFCKKIFLTTYWNFPKQGTVSYVGPPKLSLIFSQFFNFLLNLFFIFYANFHFEEKKTK